MDRRVGNVGALVAAAVLLLGPAAKASAQEAPAAAPTVGTAKATAVVVKVAPTVGSLQLALGSGISVAEVRNNLAQSQSQSLDLGLIGSTLTAEQCDGAAAPLKPSDIPRPLRIDNRGGDAESTASFVPIADLVDGLFQHVRATTAPLSEATSTAARVGLAPLLDVSGGTAVATTEMVDGGAARIAHAHVGVNLDLPGILKLTNLQWDAYHRTGTEPEAHADFTFGDMEVLGIPIPTSNLPLDSIVDTVNRLLNPLGLTVTLPHVERFTEPADVVRITPLQLRFGDSPITSVLTGPLLDATRTLRDNLAAELVKITCRAATPMLLAEILFGQLAGTGSTLISVGGAEATTGLVALEDPFGDGGLLAPTPTGDGVVTPPAAPSRLPATPSVVVPPATGGTPPAAVSTQPIGDFERVCESVHPFRWPDCSAGAAPFVGIAAVLATAAIAVLDWRHQRRRSRRAGAEAAETAETAA